MEERWSTIEEFPTYKVSNFGDVLNQSSGKLMKQSQTRTGLSKVGMVSGGVQYTRGVAVLVAEAFVFGRSDIFDTPIHLDGNQQNNRCDNLLWRPRWFAWKYARQFEDSPHNERGPILDLATDLWYDTVLDAAMANGILVRDILKSVPTKIGTFPTFQIFSFR